MGSKDSALPKAIDGKRKSLDENTRLLESEQCVILPRQPDLKCWPQNGVHEDLGFMFSFPLVSLQSILYSRLSVHVQPIERHHLFHKGLLHSLNQKSTCFLDISEEDAEDACQIGA